MVGGPTTWRIIWKGRVILSLGRLRTTAIATITESLSLLKSDYQTDMLASMLSVCSQCGFHPSWERNLSQGLAWEWTILINNWEGMGVEDKNPEEEKRKASPSTCPKLSPCSGQLEPGSPRDSWGLTRNMFPTTDLQNVLKEHFSSAFGFFQSQWWPLEC